MTSSWLLLSRAAYFWVVVAAGCGAVVAGAWVDTIVDVDVGCGGRVAVGAGGRVVVTAGVDVGVGWGKLVNDGVGIASTWGSSTLGEVCWGATLGVTWTTVVRGWEFSVVSTRGVLYG